MFDCESNRISSLTDLAIGIIYEKWVIIVMQVVRLQSRCLFKEIVNYEKQRPFRDYTKRSEDKLNTKGGECLYLPYSFFELFLNDCVDTVNDKYKCAILSSYKIKF